MIFPSVESILRPIAPQVISEQVSPYVKLYCTSGEVSPLPQLPLYSQQTYQEAMSKASGAVGNLKGLDSDGGERKAG